MFLRLKEVSKSPLFGVISQVQVDKETLAALALLLTFQGCLHPPLAQNMHQILTSPLFPWV